MFLQPFNRSLSPWQEMKRLRRDMRRLLATMPTRAALSTPSSFPAMNVWTNEDGVLITAELPGIDAQDIDISVQDGALTLRGSREPDEVEEGATYHRRERRYGRFTRVFDLPFAVEEDQVEATLNNGVLQISLPRSEADKPKKIAVKAD